MQIVCPKCHWEQNAPEGAIKAACCNQECNAVLHLTKKGAEIEASRSGPPNAEPSE